LDDVSELVRLRILFGKDRQRLMRLFLAGDIFGEGDRRSNGCRGLRTLSVAATMSVAVWA